MYVYIVSSLEINVLWPQFRNVPMKPMNTFITIAQNGSTFGRLKIWFSLGKLEKIHLLISFSVFMARGTSLISI